MGEAIRIRTEVDKGVRKHRKFRLFDGRHLLTAPNRIAEHNCDTSAGSERLEAFHISHSGDGHQRNVTVLKNLCHPF